MGKSFRSQHSIRMSGGYCWETMLHRSLMFLHILQAEELTSFIPDYLPRCLCSEEPWKIVIVFPYGT